MDEVLSLLNDDVVGYMATIDNGMPRVRPMGFMFEDNKKLYFCTANTKSLYSQLKANPYIEFSKTRKDMTVVRVRGQIEFSEDIKLKEKVMEVYPSIKMLYKSADNPVFEIFYMEHGTALIADFSGKPAREFEF